jgi:hypothetical protein
MYKYFNHVVFFHLLYEDFEILVKFTISIFLKPNFSLPNSTKFTTKFFYYSLQIFPLTA